MKIATNVHRDAFGGITISNLALFDWLQDKDDTIVGIEYVTSRHFLGAVIFRHYLPSFFSHHIINGIDVIPRFSWEEANHLPNKWKVLVDTTKDLSRQEAPGIVLINGTYYSPWILAQAARELGIPIVLRYAGVLQKEVGHKGYFVRRRLLGYERSIVSAAHAIIYPSKLCQKVVEEEIVKEPTRRGVVIPNPAHLSEDVREGRKPKGRFTIAAIGRWSRIKNFQAFIALHDRLKQEQWPHRAIMVTSYRDDQFGIPETIEQKLSMNQADLRKFYRSVDLLVVPSLFETFCNVAAEAVVHGCSVLVSKQVGFSEVLQRAGLGRMVTDSFDDPARVADAIKRLSKTPISKRERNAVARILRPQEVHERIVDVLENVLRAEPLKT